MYRLLEWAFAYDDGSGLPDAGAYAAELKNVTATADGKPVQGFDPTKTGTWTIPAGTQVNIVDMPDDWKLDGKAEQPAGTVVFTASKYGTPVVTWTFKNDSATDPDKPADPGTDALKNVAATADGKPIAGFDPTRDGAYKVAAGAKVRISDVPSDWKLDKTESGSKLVFTAAVNTRLSCSLFNAGLDVSNTIIGLDGSNRIVDSLSNMPDRVPPRTIGAYTRAAAAAAARANAGSCSKPVIDGDSLSSDMRWQREYKRQIDITQLSQQVETYDIEVDWHALGRIALDCGITIKEGDIVPLPLFRFRRFVQTEFECSSDPTVFFSHRTFNQRLAAMLAAYGLTAWNKSLNQEELKTWYEARWMPVFRFGGNYREDETTHLIGEQQEIYEAVSGETSKFLQYVEDDEQMRLRKRYLDDLYRLKENHPVLTYVRAKTEGCTILRFRICRYQTRVARSEYGREVNTPSSSWYKRALLAFCGATLVEYSYQWLRDSTFLKIVFPKDCQRRTPAPLAACWKAATRSSATACCSLPSTASMARRTVATRICAAM